MFKILKNLFENRFIVTRATGIISSPQGPSSLLPHRSPDMTPSLQYRTTNFRNLTPGAKDDKRRRPINIFCQNSACKYDKQNTSPPFYIAKENMYLERNMQKQFILPRCIPSANKKTENVSTDTNEKDVFPNNLLSRCLKFSLTSPKYSGNNLPILTLCGHPPFHTPAGFQSKCPSLLALSSPKLSPCKVLPIFPHCSSRRGFHEPLFPSYPPRPPPNIPPYRTISHQPCDSYKNIRLLKLPQCAYEYPRLCPTLRPPKHSQERPFCRSLSGNRPKPNPCEF